MDVAGLNRKQRIALVALVEAMVVADGSVSEEEGAGIGALAEALGEEEYRDLVEEVDTHFPDVEALKRYLATIKETDAREFIFGTAMEEALANPDMAKDELLEWLAKTWNVDVAMGQDEEEGSDAKE